MIASRAWDRIVTGTVPQYPLSGYGQLTVLHKGDGDIPDVVVAGYASPQVVDREKHVITKRALARDLPRFMANPKYRNANLLHSNVQVGEVLRSWKDPRTGQVYETKVDDIGLFAVVKVRTDKYRPPVVDKVIEDIMSGKMASFSISADAPFESRRHECQGGTCFWVIDEVVLYEITICETPVNPDAKFTIISKSFDVAGEFAQSAFCLDGVCPVTPGQAMKALSQAAKRQAKTPGGIQTWRQTATGPAGFLDKHKDKHGSTAHHRRSGRGDVESHRPRGHARDAAGRRASAPAEVADGPQVAGLAVRAADSGRVLMLQRALIGNEDDAAAGKWEFPGGHRDGDSESLPWAARREWSEETGCPLPPGKLTGRWVTPDGVYAGFVYTVESEADVPIAGPRDHADNPDDPGGDMVESLAWWDPSDLSDNPGVRDELAATLDIVMEAISGPRLENGVDEFDEGLEAESSEHYETVGGDMDSIANIVRDHLAEDPRYYTKLRDMEGGEEDELEPATPEKRMEKSMPADAFAGRAYEIVDGSDDRKEPALSEPVRTPKLSTPQTPFLFNAITDVVDKAIHIAEPSLRMPAFAVLAALDKGAPPPALTWMGGPARADRGDWLIWVDGTGFPVEHGYVNATKLISGLQRSASAAGDGALFNELGLALRKATTVRPLRERDAALWTSDVLSAAADLGIDVGSKLSKSGFGADVVEMVRSELERAVRDRDALDPIILAAVDALHEDAEAIVDGLRLGACVKFGDEPEHEIIERAGADGTYEDVRQAEVLLGSTESKGVTIQGPDDEDKGGPENLPGRYDDREISADADPGAMIAWFPDRELATRLAVDGGEPPNELHVTIAYLTDDAKRDLTGAGLMEAAVRAVEAVCASAGPLSGTVGGVGRFNAPGRAPIVALMDVPGLSEFRADLVRALTAAGVPVDHTHGYTPHMTLRYEDDEPGMDLEARGVPSVETTPVSMGSVRLVSAGESRDFALGGGPA